MRTLFDTERDIEIAERYQSDADVVLFEGDCKELLEEIPSDSVDLVITSPPYNIGKIYERKTSLRAYLEHQEPVIAELYRTLSSTGSICWEIGNYVQKGEVFPLDIYFYDLFKNFGMKLRNRIIWRFSHGLHASKRFSGRYEVILWFTKSEDYVFNLDSVR
ncbi:MAG: site-specific DNA-methyltransferase, partial [Gemmatimonadetes bacterium]|nr:site-specific DNA-methyltransferase [Gemmatimonadota bacterium]